MRHTNVQQLGDVIKDLIKEFKLESKLQETGIINAWNEVLGTNITRVTARIYIQKRILFVHLTSPVIRNELMMNKSNLIKALNDHVRASVIDDIVLR